MMKTEPIKILPYSEVKFRFVSDHYDLHLKGSCIYEDELCRFETDSPDWNEEKDEWEEAMTRIYKLNWREKLKWRWTQWSFEKCVGYHWSYTGKKRGQNFHYRKPQWLYKLIFNLYYLKTK